VHKLAGIARAGKVYGLDVSGECVSVARRTNRRWIKLGRVDNRHSSVSCVPFCEHLFDLVTAVETHFFWPDLVADLREVLRVLKPGGKLIIIAEVALLLGVFLLLASIAGTHPSQTGIMLIASPCHLA
jgi:SAM-dependent methyltransferase